MKTTWWKSGSWSALCDVCGFKFKAEDLTERWDGLMVCREDYETRHPQERIRPIPDQNKLPWTRPEPTDSFITIDYVTTAGCTIRSQFSQADIGTADCAIVGNVEPTI